MASIHRQPNCRNWFAAFTDADGRRKMKTTGTRDRKTALKIALQYERAAELGRAGRLTETRARGVIAEIFRIANGDRLPMPTTRGHLTGWLESKRIEVAESSAVEYARVTDDFLRHLGPKADKPLDQVTGGDIVAWRGAMAARVSAGTVNRNLKIMQGPWTVAVRSGLLERNVVRDTGTLKDRGESQRRAFTLEEIGRVLGVCDSEWRGIVLTGLYTGQRLQDIVSLRWRSVDVATGEIVFSVRKTGETLPLPMADPLQAHFMGLPAADDPGDPVFPHQCGVDTSTVSRRFHDILVSAGVLAADTAAQRKHAAAGKGRSARRTYSGLSFHCLRHTATSLLKNGGVSDVVAREIIGHRSEAVSRVYTHLDKATLRKAIGSIPDVTKCRTP